MRRLVGNMVYEFPVFLNAKQMQAMAHWTGVLMCLLLFLPG